MCEMFGAGIAFKWAITIRRLPLNARQAEDDNFEQSVKDKLQSL